MAEKERYSIAEINEKAAVAYKMFHEMYPELDAVQQAAMLGYASAFIMSTALPDNPRLAKLYAALCYNILQLDPDQDDGTVSINKEVQSVQSPDLTLKREA